MATNPSRRADPNFPVDDLAMQRALMYELSKPVVRGAGRLAPEDITRPSMERWMQQSEYPPAGLNELPAGFYSSPPSFAPPGLPMPDNGAMLRGGEGTDALMGGTQYAMQGVRTQPLTAGLNAILATAAVAAGVDDIRIISGGQPGKGSGLPRVGSTRHDHGNAADLQLIVDGRTLDFDDPNDRPIFETFISTAVGAGAPGVGAGKNYMGTDTIHVGLGSSLAWGAKGKSKNAPQWLVDAHAAGVANPVAVDPNAVVAFEAGTAVRPDDPFGIAAYQRQQASPAQSAIAGLMAPQGGSIVPEMSPIDYALGYAPPAAQETAQAPAAPAQPVETATAGYDIDDTLTGQSDKQVLEGGPRPRPEAFGPFMPPEVFNETVRSPGDVLNAGPPMRPGRTMSPGPGGALGLDPIAAGVGMPVPQERPAYSLPPPMPNTVGRGMERSDGLLPPIPQARPTPPAPPMPNATAMGPGFGPVAGLLPPVPQMRPGGAPDASMVPNPPPRAMGIPDPTMRPAGGPQPFPAASMANLPALPGMAPGRGPDMRGMPQAMAAAPPPLPGMAPGRGPDMRGDAPLPPMPDLPFMPMSERAKYHSPAVLEQFPELRESLGTPEVGNLNYPDPSVQIPNRSAFAPGRGPDMRGLVPGMSPGRGPDMRGVPPPPVLYDFNVAGLPGSSFGPAAPPVDALTQAFQVAQLPMYQPPPAPPSRTSTVGVDTNSRPESSETWGNTGAWMTPASPMPPAPPSQYAGRVSQQFALPGVGVIMDLGAYQPNFPAPPTPTMPIGSPPAYAGPEGDGGDIYNPPTLTNAASQGLPGGAPSLYPASYRRHGGSALEQGPYTIPGHPGGPAAALNQARQNQVPATPERWFMGDGARLQPELLAGPPVAPAAPKPPLIPASFRFGGDAFAPTPPPTGPVSRPGQTIVPTADAMIVGGPVESVINPPDPNAPMDIRTPYQQQHLTTPPPPGVYRAPAVEPPRPGGQFGKGLGRNAAGAIGGMLFGPPGAIAARVLASALGSLGRPAQFSPYTGGPTINTRYGSYQSSGQAPYGNNGLMTNYQHGTAFNGSSPAMSYQTSDGRSYTYSEDPITHQPLGGFS